MPRRFAPRNDKLESLHVRRECLAICSCLRRSLSAATDRETSRKGMRSPVYLAIKRNAPKLESLGAFMELLSRFELESMSRGAGSAGTRSDLGLKCASRKGMRSPVLPTVKENLQNPKALKVSGAAIQIRTGVHVPRSRLRGSPERPRIEMRFAQGMRSPVLPTVKEKPSKPEGFEGFWSCYPDSNWSPRPAEQAPREPGATSD